jgi:hypothetical protein
MTEAEKERAAIVAWLRERRKQAWDRGLHMGSCYYRDTASAIERGDHLHTPTE